MRWISLLMTLVVAAACTAVAAPVTTVEIETTTTTSTVATTTTTTGVEELARTTETTEPPPPLQLSSPAFADGEAIPARHTCDGEDLSPPLSITGIPADAEGLVIILEDPDTSVGTWDHWIEFDIPAESVSMDIAESADSNGVDGRNSWNLTGYKGPCPPHGEEHRYFFTVYAVSAPLGLPDGVEGSVVRAALAPLVIDSAELMGVYGR